MLALTRRYGERCVITVGETEIWVGVEKVSGHDRVKLQFTAPDYVRIDREEIHQSRLANSSEVDIMPPQE